MDEIKEVEKQLLDRMLELYAAKNQGKSVTAVERLFIAGVQNLIDRKEIQYDSAMEFFDENGIDGELSNPDERKRRVADLEAARRVTPPEDNGWRRSSYDNGCGGGGRGYQSSC